jgi:hypothetical protein
MQGKGNNENISRIWVLNEVEMGELMKGDVEIKRVLR